MKKHVPSTLTSAARPVLGTTRAERHGKSRFAPLPKMAPLPAFPHLTHWVTRLPPCTTTTTTTKWRHPRHRPAASRAGHHERGGTDGISLVLTTPPCS